MQYLLAISKNNCKGDFMLSLSEPSNLSALLLWGTEFPDDIPVYQFRGETIYRHQLKEDVARKAVALGKIFSPGDRIVICLNDSCSLVSLFLAAVAVGAVPAIVNPRCRESTLCDLLAQSEAKGIFLVEDRAEGSVRESGVQVFCDKGADDISFASFGLHEISGGCLPVQEFYKTEMDECCYLQYTSGSTGKPKAVMHSVASTLGFCRALTNYIGGEIGWRSYSAPRMFFGYGMGNSLFFPLYAGWHALVHPGWPTPECVRESIEAFCPDLLFAVPVIYSHLKSHEGCLEKVRVAISAGSPLPEPEYRFWAQKGLHLCDGLGATEMGHIFMAQPHSLREYSCAGAPLPGYECELRDQAGVPVVENDREGVLFVRGPGMAAGYRGMPEVTDERFAHGWYKTGDLFSRDRNGFHHFRGRVDDLFKVRGRWVTPQMVEQRLLESFSEITEVALVASDMQDDQYNPTLFIAGCDLSDGFIDKVESWIKLECEPQMVPRSILPVDALPRNDNGKLDRKEAQKKALAFLRSELSVKP
ncbi:AMP-binding protein [Microbulbifer halophilus]|uniref:AMP-binding protein n=1 Tax=Microbulbifer halophilus TaxID=453963 RepID=A0ABW5E6H5_9GAMM|nr:AMP-binding protein [Microbulbifer halophilus]MCW8126896.1 AMP-binding protein [Microbulbifer halophilus]